MSPRKNYVYCLYSGRTPIKVSGENESGKGYIFVEQFDWNGNPVRKLRLDECGYFCVSEDEERIFMLGYKVYIPTSIAAPLESDGSNALSMNTEEPLIIYDLPPVE